MARPTTVQLALIRCGRTDWDEVGRLQGKSDRPLSPSGLTGNDAMMESMSAEFGPGSFATVHCATDEASRATAAHVTEQFGGKVRPSEDLQAMDLGVWEGLLESEVEERYPTAFGQWREDPASVNPPEGETWIATETGLLGAMARAVDKAGVKGVAFVLRPLEFALARCLLHGEPTERLWDLLEDGPAYEVFTIERSKLRSLLESRKAGA